MSDLSLLPVGTSLVSRSRHVGRIEQVVGREIVMTHGRAQVLAERGRANAIAIESVAFDAMQAGAQVAQQASALAAICPSAEPMLRSIVQQTGLALGQVVSDTARDLRR